LTSFVVIKDSHITKRLLEGDKYFNDSAFSMNGKFSGLKIDKETLNLLKNSGYKVSDDAILLERGEKPIKLLGSIIFAVIASLISIVSILTLFSIELLHKIFGFEQEIIKI